MKSLISSTELFPISETNTQSEKTIQNTKEDIKVLEEAINEIKEGLALKTSEQRTSDETKISQNQTKINTLTQSIEEQK
ncbi:hypothetical protein P0E68_12385 [Enterococcus faecalis]|uniref:hypothetical protein n=1 Tax=Enterococcus faecalis TaxID=1351 RepID=UPI0025B02E2E|nr:hypothetical protein [Enterococcus faecalis]MDN3109467.1 hypothetical protein [Enterococcus faecalis]